MSINNVDYNVVNEETMSRFQWVNKTITPRNTSGAAGWVSDFLSLAIGCGGKE